MGQFTLIKRNGTRIPLNKRIPFCAVKTAQQSRSLMADDTVTLEVVSTFLIDFEKGDKIKIDSDWYTIRTTVDRTKNSEDQYNYSITLYGCIYDLMKVMFRDTDVNGRSTSLTFDLTYSIKDFVKVIIYNMNRDYPGEWVFDDKDCPETEPKTVSFSCQNCLQTLQNECKDFDVDFQITTDKDGIHHIKIGKFGSVVTPPNGEKYFQWGRGHGLFTLVEGKVDDKAIITRMYGEGGTNNIPTAYRNYSERLQLPYPQRLNKHDHKLSDGTVVKAKTMQIGCTDDNKRYIEDAALSKKIGVEEDAIQNDDIYPRRTGKVTALGDDVYTFMDDTMDFDLKASNSNGTTYLIDGTSAKITFITGRLAGREFELHDYDHSAKKFILKPYKDARGLVFPTSNTTAFQIREGDQYKITDIIMPDSYIEDAEEDLWFYVYDKFLQAKQARAQYALTFSRSYFIENMPKDSDSCLFTPGDYVPIKDERFNLEKNIRIQKVERNLLLRHDYTLTISDTATISIINQAVINVQKHDTILEANRLKDLTRAKYGWRTTEELRNMIYDPDGYFDTDNIKPNSIDTNMLTVGSKSQQFVLADVIMQANLGGDPNLFKATSGTLCHLSISDTDIRYWKIAALEATLSEAGCYYLFAKCSKKGDTGSWYLTQEQLKFEPTSDPNNYYFQVGVLSSVYDDSWRDFVTTYGFTRINGNTITTGKIVTSDGYCYLDLDGNKFRMGDKQSYIDYNVQQRGQITLHNVRLLSTSGDSSEIGVYRGEYNASYVYYKGDEVSYTNNGVTATYRYIYSEPTKGYAPTVGTYWQCIAKGKDGEKGTPGAPGEDGRTSYTHFKYSNDGGLSFTGNNGEEPGSYLGQYTDFEEMDSSNPTRYTWALIQGEAGNSGVDAAASSYFECRYAKNGSTVEPPTLDATALEPTGWSLQMPSVGKLEYLWMSMAQKCKLVEQTYCHIPFTAKDGCKDITGNYSTELGSGGSIVTEGDRQFLSLPDDSDLRIKYDLPFGENFTIFFWFKTDQKNIGWAIQDAAFTLNMKEMDVKPGTWMHLAFRFSDRTVSCFLNGVRQATASLNKKLIGFTVYDSNMYASANCYDEFRMVNGALADVDIVNVYQDKADKLLSNWSVPTRISPYDGKDGVSVMARYSSDKQNWHTSFQTGDQWMQTSSDSGNTWGEACKIVGEDGRDGTDGYSLAPIYRGEYSASKTYYGTQYRVDIVKYNGIYYVSRVDAGTFSNVAPTNTSKWNPFGAQFESIATNLLLAEGANIGDWFLSGGKIVSTLSTTSSGKITLDAKGGLIQVESAISGGDHSLYTTMGAKITLDANRGVVHATAKNAPSYSTGTAYMSPSGIFANMAGTDSISASTGRLHRSAIVGLGFANVSKSAYELNADETLVAGVYGRADNQGSAPAYGGYFWDLKACGLILNTRFIGDSSSYSERCIPKSVSFVIGLCNMNVVRDVYLPNDTKNGRIIKFKQMGSGAMRVRPMSGQHIYDDTTENDYYDCGEGQCLEFVFGIWVKGSTTTNVWTVSKYKY